MNLRYFIAIALALSACATPDRATEPAAHQHEQNTPRDAGVATTSAPLHGDDFDRPAAASVAEAARASGDVEADHSEHAAPAEPAGHHDHGTAAPATPTPPRKPAVKKAAPSAAQVIYVCPMHPEVTSKSPGKCPKCGMTLVKKGK
jgi:hypothetical protein